MRTMRRSLTVLALCFPALTPALVGQCTPQYFAARGLGNRVLSLCHAPNGDVVAGGRFSLPGGNCIAQWDGSSWTPIGGGTDLQVLAALSLRNGDLLIGGQFDRAGGSAADRVARWDGSNWVPTAPPFDRLLGFLNPTVHALAELPGGDLVVGGNFAVQTSSGSVAHLARTDGSSWRTLDGFVQGTVRALLVTQSGDLIAGGDFTGAGSTNARSIARFDGQRWRSMGTQPTNFNGEVRALAELANGDIIAGGAFSSTTLGLQSIARWDGSSWHPMGQPWAVNAVTALPNGDVIAAGDFRAPGTSSDPRIGRWNGTAWSFIGPAATYFSGAGEFNALAFAPHGELMVGGQFTTAGGINSNNAVGIRTPCPATTTSIGASCSGSARSLMLSPVELPWTGSTFRARSSAFSANAVGAVLAGVSSPNLPLSTWLPTAPVGCALLTSGEVAVQAVLNPGSTDIAIAVPDVPALAGLELFLQAIQLEFGSQGSSGPASSSNALRVVVGSF